MNYKPAGVLRVIAALGVGVLLGVVASSQLLQPSASQRIEAGGATAAAPEDAVSDVPLASKGPTTRTWRDGMYLVGTDLVPGRYVSRGIGPACYYAVATDLGGSLRSVVTSHFGDAFGRRVELGDGQYFETDACGDWALEAPE